MDPDDAVHILHRRTHQPPEFGAGRWVLVAEHDWIVRGPAASLVQVLAALGSSLCEGLSPDLLLLRFGNAVGFFDVPHLGRIEVVSGKWSQGHFDRMLADVMAVASGLPFSAGTGGSLPYDRSVVTRQDVLYHAFVYLRYVLSDKAPTEDRLLPVLHLILREPHSRFERFRRSIPTEQASRVSTSGLLQTLGRPAQMLPVRSPTLRRLPLAHALGGRLPAEVIQDEVRSTVDTPENRFVLMFLRFAEGIISGMEQALVGDGPFAARVYRDCAAMTQSLASILRHPLWREVGPMIHLPASSTVLHRRRGYRDVFRHFGRVRLATRLPLSPQQARDLLEAKDIALLYELWAFFTIVSVAEGILGPPLSADAPSVSPLQVSVPHGFRVAWPDGTELYYNRSFSRSAPAVRRSYSVPLRPDIVLEVPAGPNAGLHLFDAKFKLDSIDAVLSDADVTEEDAAEERQGTFKRADLYKMHTYRDAIDRTRSVWIVYPGTTVRLFHTDEQVYTRAGTLPQGALCGVGAIPLQPLSGAHAALTVVLRCLLTA